MESNLPFNPLSLLFSSKYCAKPKSATFRIGGFDPLINKLLGFRSMWETLFCLQTKANNIFIDCNKFVTNRRNCKADASCCKNLLMEISGKHFLCFMTDDKSPPPQYSITK